MKFLSNTPLATGLPVIDSEAFAWILFIGFVFVACAMVIGFASGYKDGYSDGFEDAERFIETELDLAEDEWAITDAGRQALRQAKRAEIDSMLLTPQQTMPFVKTHSHVS